MSDFIKFITTLKAQNFCTKKTNRKSTFAIFLKTLKNVCFMSPRTYFFTTNLKKYQMSDFVKFITTLKGHIFYTK